MVKILYIARDESKWVFRGPHYFQQALARVARVHFARQSGSIKEILAQTPFSPDIIVLHMQPLNEAPIVTDLDALSIPKAMYVEDVHYRSKDLVQFAISNDVQLVFCPYREHFHRYLAPIADRFRWLPHCVDPDVFRDYRLPKEIDLLMMGQIVPMYYPIRKAMLERFNGKPGFVHRGHPGYVNIPDDDPRFFVGARYAQEINRAKIFLTCGSKWHVPVAKYFEAPACGSCLLAPGGADFPDLGFEDGKTFVECTIDNFEQRAVETLNDPGTLKRITKQGHEMIMDRHTASVRAGEFLALIKECL